MNEKRETSLSRWARLKKEHRTLESSEPPLEENPTENAVVEAESTEAVSETDLPDIETLDAQSDYSVFLHHDVPDEIRKLALRKLWASDPIFANIDGLNDYDEDFSSIIPLAKEVVREIQQIMAKNREQPPEFEEEGSELAQEPAEEEQAEDPEGDVESS